MAVLGEVNEIIQESVFEWKLKDFSLLLEDVGVFYSSPEIAFGGDTWDLMIFPNVQTKATLVGSTEYVNTDGCINIALRRTSSGPPITLEYSLRLKTMEQKIDPKYPTITNTFKSEMGCGFRLIRRSKLLERKSEFVPSDILTIICNLKLPKSPKFDNDAATEKCSYCENTFDVATLSSHEKKCMKITIRCPYCFDNVLLKDWLYNHKCQMEETDELKCLRKKCADAELMLEKRVRENDEIKREVEAYKIDVLTFKTNNEKLLKEKLDLEADLKAFGEDLDDLRNENISLKRALDVAEASLGVIKQSDNFIKKHQADLETLRENYLDTQLKLERTLMENNNIKKELEDYKADVLTLEPKNETPLMNKLDLEADLKAIREDLDDLRNENISLKKTLEGAEASIIATKQSVVELNKERAAHQGEIKNLLDTLKNHQAGGCQEDVWSSSSSDSNCKDDSYESSSSDNKDYEFRPSESDSVKVDCSYCKGTFDAEIISSHEKKCVVKCPECLNNVFYQNWLDHECSIPRTEGSLFRSWISIINSVRL